jgi:hypothetical protein
MSVAIVSAVVCSAGNTLAGAAAPVRTANPLPTYPFILTDTLQGNPCAFPVLALITTNREYVTTFARESGVTTIFVTGALDIRLTNVVTGHTIVRNISGPIQLTLNADGSVKQVGLGPSLWVFDPGVAPNLPRLALTAGRTESQFSPQGVFTFTYLRGYVEDLCSALSA